jgi:anti-sigma factor RsiW
MELAERLSEYLDGELPPDLRDRVEEHFDGCVQCEKFLLSLRRVKGLGDLLPCEQLSAEKLRSLAESVRRRLGS